MTESAVTLYSAEQGAAPILMDTAYEDSEQDSHASRTHTQIARAVNDLRQDIAMVNGSISYKEIQQIFVDDEEKQAERLEKAGAQAVPSMIYDQIGEGKNCKNAIIVGAVGDSTIIDQMIEDGKLDEAKEIEGKWEGYVIKNVENPVPGVDHALVIAGSDARGTIYGIYTVSEEIGVSPFYWYSDVPVDVKDSIEVDYSEAVVNEGPKVKYRGIFINDEDMSIEHWAKKKFPTGNGTPDINYYRKVFELMLRLKCNLLWPAMHELSTSFAAATDENGIPINSKEASKYGIVIGSSHCEILLRSNTGEWWNWYSTHRELFTDSNAQDYYSSYDFSANKKALLQYWRERLEKTKDFESVLTLGIRGIHDGAYNCIYKDKYYGGSDVKFMEDVIKEQRKLIAEVYFDGDMSRLSEIPQVLIPYKEMGTVYNDGLKDFMAQPEYSDITLVWAEDNHGYLRQTPNQTEKERPGGAGVYYHASYWGSPTSYLWLNSIPLSLLSEQLHRAYDEGMQNQWILNVGDIKPGDQSMEFYAKMAWDPESYDDTNVEEYLKEQAIRDWNVSSEDADTIAAAVMKYYKMQGTKKAEYYNRTLFPFSATANGDEVLLWQERSQEIVDQLTPIYEAMDEDIKTAFYEQIYYHVLSINDAAKEYAYYWKAVQASEQGRVGSTTVYNALSKTYRDHILNRVDDYNSLNNNKWTGYMSWKHCTGDEDQGHDILKDSEYPSIPSSKHGVGAAAEGQTQAGSGTLRLESTVQGDQRYFDVFAMESGQCQWVTEAPEWIQLSMTSGETSTEQRVIVTADWEKMEKSETGEIKVYNAKNGEKTGNAVATFTVRAEKSDLDPSSGNGFIEADGYVAVEAEHYSDMEEGSDGSNWGVIVNSGQHGDTMKAYPNHDRSTPESGAKLIYNIYFKHAGTFKGMLNCLPTLDEDNRTRDIGISANGGEVQTLSSNPTTNDYWPWAYNVQRMYSPLSFELTVKEGWNTIEITRLDPAMIVDRFIIETENGALSGSLIESWNPQGPKNLMGPVESPNGIAQGEAIQKAKIAKLPAEFEGYVTYPTMELTKNGDTEAYEAKTGIKTASISEKRVAEITVEEGVIMATPKRPGIATVTAETDEGDPVSFTLQVNLDPNETGAYQEENGKVIIDAYSALEESKDAFTSGQDGHEWVMTDIGVQDTPDTGATWRDTSVQALEGKAPGLNYKVNIQNAGTYYLYVNTSNPNVNADSYHIAVDGQYQYVNAANMDGKETWYSYGQAITLDAGEHTITLYAREDGYSLNQMLLSTKADEALSGIQEASCREGESAETIQMDTLNPVKLEEGQEEELEVTASASNASRVSVKAKSANKKIAEVEASEVDEEGVFTLRVTGHQKGHTTITLTAKAAGCAEKAETFRVSVLDGEEEDGLLYQADDDGRIVINAVDALFGTEYAYYDDENSKYETSEDNQIYWDTAEGDKSIQLYPISEVNGADGDGKWVWTDPVNYEAAPSLGFHVYVEEEGDYYWSFFANSPNLATDSYHLVVNGEYQYHTGDGVNGAGDAAGPNWYTCHQKIRLNAGENTIELYGRESGLLLRQLMISKENPSGISGWQTACEPTTRKAENEETTTLTQKKADAKKEGASKADEKPSTEQETEVNKTEKTGTSEGGDQTEETVTSGEGGQTEETDTSEEGGRTEETDTSEEGGRTEETSTSEEGDQTEETSTSDESGETEENDPVEEADVIEKNR